MSIVRTAPRLAAFLDVRGSRALVVGAGAVGAHKAEALLRSGAEVTVVAPELCPSMARLAQSGALRLE
ncbi:MAG: NAD(P)-dependent oxidoreductase [Bacillota bacterium]